MRDLEDMGTLEREWWLTRLLRQMKEEKTAIEKGVKKP